MSLRARLLIALAAVAFVALVAADALTFTELHNFLYGQVDSNLVSSVVAIETAVGSPPPNSGNPVVDHDHDHDHGNDDKVPEPPEAGPNFCNLIAHSLAPGTYVSVHNAKGSVVQNDDCPAIVAGGKQYSPSLPSSFTGLGTGAGDRSAVFFSSPSSKSGGPAFRVRVSLLSGGALQGDRLVLAQPLTSTHETLERLLGVELAVTGGALVVAVLLGFWLVRLGLRPLRRVEATAESISAGDLAHRVPGADPRTEVGRVALALNYMLEGIEQAFVVRDETETQLRASEERLRRFVADASHELRTPVAAVSAYAELFDRVQGLPGADIARIMSGIRNETSRMGALVEDLLLLARLDEGKPTARQVVELVDLVGGAIETALMVGPEWPVQIEATEAVEVIGDHNRLRQVIDNLLGNVRAHTPPGTTTTVRIERIDHEVLIRVADDGPGISEEQAARVFERFYRADASRTRSRGGAGLGLSIVASIVRAHGGSVKARPGDGGGATFEVRLPSVDAPSGDDEDEATDPAGDGVDSSPTPASTAQRLDFGGPAPR